MKKACQVALIITAAGNSSRFNTGEKKELLPLCSKIFPSQPAGTVLSCGAEHFLQFFSESSNITLCSLVITMPTADDRKNMQKALFASPFVTKTLTSLHTEPGFIVGGNTRQESVFFALTHLRNKKTSPDIVLIHDGARPFADANLISRVIRLAKEKDASIAAIPPTDTQKQIDKNGIIINHLNRDELASAQTPQAFHFAKLFAAYEKAMEDNQIYTDDAAIWGKYVGNVYTCKGSIDNIKITYKHDLECRMPALPSFRIGFGYDLHRLTEGRVLVIGGIRIPFEKGEDAHSDGDVLLHAVTDALLGATGLGDIGEFFPSSDNTWKDADSAQLLKTAFSAVTKNGWALENLDCVLALEKPKFLPWREKVCLSIARILNCETQRIFVKAKTGEGLGDIGNSEAICAWATCLLKKS